MYQELNGKWVEVVQFDTLPPLPITGLTDHEKQYESMLSMARGYIHRMFDPMFTKTGKYARALDDAIRTGIIKEGGKYAIYLVPGTDNYEIYKILE